MAGFLIDENLFNILFLLTVVLTGVFLYGQGAIGNRLLENTVLNPIIEAKILRETPSNSNYRQYEIKINSVYIKEQKATIKINEKAHLSIYGSPDDLDMGQLIAGDVIRIKGGNIKKLLKDYKKDSLNNYELYLKSKGLQYILNINIKDMSKVNVKSKHMNISSSSYAVKTYLEDYLDATLDFENSDILKSIIFGNQGYLSKDKLEMFSKTGTAHIMAVSGLHVGLIVLIVNSFLGMLKIGKNTRLYLTTFVLVFYGYIVYFPVSIVRAGAMYFLYVIAYFFHRRYDSINGLFFIAFVLLVYNPMTIFSISFQLSFAASLGILVLAPVINEKLDRLMGPIAALLSVTLAAQIVTLPIMAYHFKQVSLVSIVTNLIIIPLIAPILTVAFISVLAGLLSFRTGLLINRITNSILDYINWVTSKSGAIPYSSIEVGEIRPIYLIGYYIIVLGFIYFICANKEKNKLVEERPVRTYEL